MVMSILVTITGLTVGVLACAGTMKALSYFIAWLSKK